MSVSSESAVKLNVFTKSLYGGIQKKKPVSFKKTKTPPRIELFRAASAICQANIDNLQAKRLHLHINQKENNAASSSFSSREDAQNKERWRRTQESLC